MANKLNIVIGVKFDAAKAITDLNTQLKTTEARMNKMTKVNGDGAIGLNKMSTASKHFNHNMKQSTKEASGFMGMIKKAGKSMADAFGKFLVWGSIAALIGIAKRSIQELYTVVKDIDTAFTQLAIVTGATASEISDINGKIEELTGEVGRLKKEVIGAVTEFARAGYTISESMILAKNAIIGANVGMTDLATTSKVLIAALKSFNLEAEDSARIIDVLFNISRNAAITFEGIGEAFLRSANSLKVAGATLEEGAALIAAANESIQDPSKVGTALKTISARLRGLDVENNVPKLAKALNQVGIEIQDNEGNFRDIFSIFQELSYVFDDLDDLTKQNIIEQLAGKRQANILIGLLDNFKEAENAVQDGLNSMGTAALENEKYLESIEGRVVLLKEAVNELFEALISSGFIKLIVSGLTNIAKALKSIVEASPAIMIIGGVASAIIGLGNAIAYTSLLATEGLATLALGFMPIAPLVLGITAAVVGLTIAFRDNEKIERQKLESTQKYIDAQQKLNDIIREGTELEKEKLKTDIEKLLAQRAKILKEIREVSSRAGDSISGFGGLGEITELQNGLNNIDKALADLGININDADDAIDNLTKSTNEATNALDEYAIAMQILKENVSSFNLANEALDELKETGYLTEKMLLALTGAFPDLAEVTKLESDAMMEFLNTRKKSLLENMQIDIDNTQNIIDNAKLRITAYIEEAKLLNTLNGEDARREQVLEKLYGNTLNEIEKQEIQLNRQQGNLDALFKTEEDRENSAKKTSKALTEQERTYESIRYQIDTLEEQLSRVEGKDRIDTINEIISLYDDLDMSIDDVVDALSSQELTQDELTDATRKYRLEQEKGITTIFGYRQEIDELNITLIKLTKLQLGDVDNVNKKYKDYFEKQKDRYKKDLDAFKKLREARIKAIEDEIESLERIFSDDTYEQSQSELNKKLLTLEMEKEKLSLDNSLQAKKRKLEIEEEMVDVKGELAENLRGHELELNKRTLNDKKDAINEEIRLEEERYEKNLAKIENYFEQTTKLIDSFENNWYNLGETFGEALMGGLLPKLEEIAKQVEELTGVKIDMGSIDMISPETKPTETVSKVPTSLLEHRKAVSSMVEKGEEMLAKDPTNANLVNSIQMARNKLNELNDKIATYHDGGTVGDNLTTNQQYLSDLFNLNNDEIMAKLQKGEMILTNPQTESMAKNIMTLEKMALRGGNTIGSMVNVENVNINADDGYGVQRLSKDLTIGAKNQMSKLGRPNLKF